MVYFLNLINITAIFLMLGVYFLYNIINPQAKKYNPKIVYYEIACYIYLSVLAGLINIMNSINISDAVFWYGASLSFGVKSAIFIVIIAGLLMGISIYFSPTPRQELNNMEVLLKSLQDSVMNISSKQSEFSEASKDFKNRFSQIATPEEVNSKIREMVDENIDQITSDIQHLSDKTAVIAEQLTNLKNGGESNLPSVSVISKNYKTENDSSQIIIDEKPNSLLSNY